MNCAFPSRKRKWFINGSYNIKALYQTILSVLIASLMNIARYQNFLFWGYFNASVSEKCLAEFGNLNGLNSLMKKPTCLKNPDKPTCIDLILKIT